MILFRRKILGLTKEQEKEFTNVQKTVKRKAEQPEYEEDYTDIRLLLASELEMYSKFSVLSKEKINMEIMDYISDQAKYIPVYQTLNIIVKFANGKTSGNLSKLETMYKRNVMNALIDCEHELKRNLQVILSMILFGSIAMASSLFFSKILDVFVLRELLVIACWVFIWRAVESYFFSRKRLKARQLKLIQLYLAEFEEE